MLAVPPWTPQPPTLCSEEGLQAEAVVHRDPQGQNAEISVLVRLVRGSGEEEGDNTESQGIKSLGEARQRWGRRTYSSVVQDGKVQTKEAFGSLDHGQEVGGFKIHSHAIGVSKLSSQRLGGNPMQSKGVGGKPYQGVGEKLQHSQGVGESWWSTTGGRRRGTHRKVYPEVVKVEDQNLYNINNNYIHQDELSTVKLEENQESDEIEDQNMKSEEKSTCECRICGKDYSDLRSLRWHIKDVHNQSIHKCKICEKTFSNHSNLNKHIRFIHEKLKNKLCHSCGEVFSRIEDLRGHESVCLNASKVNLKNRKKFGCSYCHKKVTTRTKLKAHISKKHEKLDVKEESFRRKSDLECEICSKKMKSSRNLEHHIKSVHYPERQPPKEEECTDCEMKFSCKEMLNEHLVIVHNKELKIPCLICTKSYKSRRVLGDHYRKDHSEETHTCLICQKTYRRKSTLKIHIKRHSNPPCLKKPLENLSKSEYNKRRRQTEQKICDLIKKFPEKSRKSIVKNILKENPGAVDEMDPLTEDEVIDIIKDLSISDRVMLQILRNLRKKWGRKIITPNIKNCLRDRKLLVEDFFTQVTLDETTENNFTDSEGNIVRRHISYCHDIEGLLTFKEMLEIEKHGNGIAQDVDQVIGLDGGVKKLIMTHTWCPKEAGGMRRKLSQKNTIILAAVAEVPENIHNIRTIFALTQVNKLSYLLSSDLKLWLLGLGLGSNSSTYACGLGECRKESKRGKWIKGPNRTISNICEERRRWLLETEGNRKKLNQYKNCEHEPVIRPQFDENSPIFHWQKGVKIGPRKCW